MTAKKRVFERSLGDASRRGDRHATHLQVGTSGTRGARTIACEDPSLEPARVLPGWGECEGKDTWKLLAGRFQADQYVRSPEPKLEEGPLTDWMFRVSKALATDNGKNVNAVFPMGGGKSSVSLIGMAIVFKSYTHLQPRVLAVQEAYARSVETMVAVSNFCYSNPEG